MLRRNRGIHTLTLCATLLFLGAAAQAQPWGQLITSVRLELE